LKYNEDGSSAVSSIKRISKPGRRVYVQYTELKPVRSGYGISIISTSKGLLTNKEAHKQKIGGEFIAEIW
jgi:small subunit ribosomal protein S8